jgi:hypothetical protein
MISLWRVSSFGIWRHVVRRVSTNVSEEHIASIFLATCLLAFFFLNVFLRPWRWRRYVSPKRRLKLDGLHGVISQKMILFITSTVKTSNPTWFYFTFSQTCTHIYCNYVCIWITKHNLCCHSLSFWKLLLSPLFPLMRLVSVAHFHVCFIFADWRSFLGKISA